MPAVAGQKGRSAAAQEKGISAVAGAAPKGQSALAKAKGKRGRSVAIPQGKLAATAEQETTAVAVRELPPWRKKKDVLFPEQRIV